MPDLWCSFHRGWLVLPSPAAQQPISPKFQDYKFGIPFCVFIMLGKRSYSDAFNVAAGTYLFNALKRRRIGGYGSYNIGPNEGMAKFRKSRLRGRYGSRTITKRRRGGRFGNRLVKRIRRISRTLHRKGLKSIEIKYNQAQLDTGNTALGALSIGTLLEGGAVASNNAKVSLTSGMVRGTDRAQRVGDKVFIRHVRVRGLIQASTSANAAAEVYVTLLILRVKQAQGTTTSLGTEVPYLTNVYEYINNTATLSSPPNGQNGSKGAFVNHWNWINMRWKNDFHILKKKTFAIGKPDGNPPLKRFFKFNIPVFKPAHWEDYSNPQDGHIYLYYWCDEVRPTGAIVDGDRPQMWLTWRMSYTDC